MTKLLHLRHFALLLIMALSSCASNSTINIPPGEEFVLGEQENSSFRLELKNLGREIIDVRAVDKTEGVQTQGFGLDGKSKARLRIRRGEMAVISNPSQEAIKVKAKMTKTVAGMRYQPIPDTSSPEEVPKR